MKKLAMVTLMLFMALGGCTTHYSRVNGSKIHLYLKESKAKDVYFASSLDGFELHRAQQKYNGLWEVTVPLGDEFSYFYMADGVLLIPPCTYKEKDDFGSENCIFIPEL
jgi:hypothetical protein